MMISATHFRRAVSACLALVLTSLTLGMAITPVPAAASTSATVFYTAQLASPTAQTGFVSGGVVWYCEGTRCVAAKGTSRPVTVCRKLNRKVGEVTSFVAKGEALEAEMLDQCNGR